MTHVATAHQFTQSNPRWNARELITITVSGEPKARGEQQGEALRGVIDTTVRRWMQSIHARHELNPDDYLADLIQQSGHVQTMETRTPDLLQEIKGIARGSGQSENRIIAYNLLDEEWAFAKSRATAEPPGCTAAGFLHNDQPAVIGQTMDIPTVHDGSQCAVIHQRDEMPDLTVFTAAGIIGLMGVNAAGVGVVVNNLSSLPVSQSGLPVSCVLRRILDQASGKEAAAFVHNVAHAVGQHYLIGDPHQLWSIESDANQVQELQLAGSVCVHTNHPIADSAATPQSTTSLVGNSRARFDKMVETLTNPLNIEDLEFALSDTDVPISREPVAGLMTFGAMVAELSAPPIVMMLAGPPHLGKFQQIEVA